MEETATDGAESAQGGQRVGYVFRNGRLRREVLPPEAPTAPAVVGGGPGLEANIPLPLEPPPEFWEMAKALDAECVLCHSTEPHLHGSKLFEAGRELF